MNLLFIIIIISILLLTFKTKERFSDWGFKNECWEGLCFPVPKVPSPNDIFNDIKKKIENDVINPAKNELKKGVNTVKSTVDKAIKDVATLGTLMKNVKFESI